MFEFLTQVVPLWKVVCVAAPVLLVVHSIFHDRKFFNRLYLPPILSLVLITWILYMFGASGGMGKGPNEDPGKDEASATASEKTESTEQVKEKTENPPDSPSETQSEGAGGTTQTPPPAKPISLEIQFFKEKGKFRFRYEGKDEEVSNPDSKLAEMQASGYVFESVKTIDFEPSDLQSLREKIAELQGNSNCVKETIRSSH